MPNNTNPEEAIKFLKISVAAVGLLFILVSCFGTGKALQDQDWKTKTFFNDKFEASYRISEENNENGEMVVIIEDHATTTDSLSLQACTKLMRDVPRHKEFTGDKVTEIIRTVSDSQWVVYYYTDNPWPLKNSDCVAVMTLSENPEEKSATVTLTAAPTELEMRGVNRMLNYNIRYDFNDLGNGTVQISMSGRTTPPVKVPVWVIKSAFPKAPANSLRKFVQSAREGI